MTEAWKSIISKKVIFTYENIDQKIQLLQTQMMQNSLQQEITRQMKQALQTDKCPTCLRTLDEEAIRHLTNFININHSDVQPEDNHELHRLLSLKLVLRNFSTINILPSVQELTEAIDQCIVDRAAKQDRIAEIDDNIRNLDQSEIRKIRSEYGENFREITLVEEGMRRSTENIQKNEESIRDVERQLDKEKGVDLAKENQRRDLYDNLYNLFDEGVSVYRERLRKKVENDRREMYYRERTFFW